jgi:hypothetical protein
MCGSIGAVRNAHIFRRGVDLGFDKRPRSAADMRLPRRLTRTSETHSTATRSNALRDRRQAQSVLCLSHGLTFRVGTALGRRRNRQGVWRTRERSSIAAKTLGRC